MYSICCGAYDRDAGPKGPSFSDIGICPECRDHCEFTDHFCSDCGEPCFGKEETFDYAGTHCTNGRPGTHRTGNYISDCCGAELENEPLED